MGLASRSAVFLVALAWAALAGACARTKPAKPGVGATDAGGQADGPAGEDGHPARADGAIEHDAPGTPEELCGNGLDDNANGLVDEGCPCAPGAHQSCYPGPATLAGVGACAAGTQLCDGRSEFGSWGPCEGAVTPSAELCDGIDNDCDGTVDEGCECTPGATRACYGGSPGTAGIGPCAPGTQPCDVTATGSLWGACAGQTLPSPELCDGIDNNCDGTVDDGCLCVPGATRACFDGPAAARHVGVCADGSQTCLVGAGGVGSDFGPCAGEVLPGVESCNGLDDDCNGKVDDGVTRACGSSVGDCRPGTETCAAGVWGACVGGRGPSPEDCNGGDENCNGMIDEGCTCFDGTTAPCGGPAVGVCKVGTKTCVNGQYGPCVGAVAPSVEMCDGLDNDCNGTVDDGCLCIPGQTRPCYDGPSGTAGVAACRAGSQLCAAVSGDSMWGPCTGEVLPAAEVCNGLDDDCNGAADDGVETPEQVLTPRVPNRNADILFMIDDSLSMDLNQASLVANFPVLMQTLRAFPGGLPNLHIAVVTSDLGAGMFSIPRCVPGGDGGTFHAPAPTATCLGPHGSFIDESNGEATKNYDGTIEDAFSCIAQVGTLGCGLEHQIASAAVALGFRGSVPVMNQGFLRPDAPLAVVFITNEDDCSAPPDTPIFDPTSISINDPFGALWSYRCNEYGHLCGGVKPPRLPPPGMPTPPVTLTDCHSAEDGVLYRVSDLASFFLSLKADPSMIFVSAIAAPVTPYTVTWIDNLSRPGEVMPNIAHSCTRTDGAFADPAVRMSEFVARFGANGTFSSICDDSYAPALTQLGNTIGRALGPQCLTATIPDHDAVKPGIQATCQVVLHVTDGTGHVSDQPLPACSAATPTGGPAPCWYLTANAACTSGTEFVINRTDPLSAGETVSVRCNPCR